MIKWGGVIQLLYYFKKSLRKYYERLDIGYWEDPNIFTLIKYQVIRNTGAGKQVLWKIIHGSIHNSIL